MLIRSVFFCCLFSGLSSGSAYECHVAYPISFLQPVTGPYFSGNLTSQQLTCFGNREYLSASFLDTFGCLVGVFSECFGLWGSRAVMFESEGSIEVFRVDKLPVESVTAVQPVNASRWVQLSVDEEGALELNEGAEVERLVAREAKQVAAEPVFFCARCNDWRDNRTAPFKAMFRQAYYRYRDIQICRKHVLLLSVAIFGVTAMPVAAKAFMIAMGAYMGFTFGLQRFIVIYIACTLCCLVLPLIRRRSIRRFFRYYSKTLFKNQKYEAVQVLRHSLELMDIVFLSSLLVTAGSLGVYGLFYYDWIVRETRNFAIKGLIAVAVACLFSFFCRTFDRIIHIWGWTGIPLIFSQLILAHVNPGLQSQVVASVFAIAFTLRRLALWLLPLLPLSEMYRVIPPQVFAFLEMTGMTTSIADDVHRFVSSHIAPNASSAEKLTFMQHPDDSSATANPGSILAVKSKKKYKNRRNKSEPLNRKHIDFTPTYFSFSPGSTIDVLTTQFACLATDPMRSTAEIGLKVLERLHDSTDSVLEVSSSFERTLQIKCNDKTAAVALVETLALHGGAWGSSISPDQLQRVEGASVIVCELCDVFCHGNVDAVACVRVKFHFFTYESVTYYSLTDHEIQTGVILFIKNYYNQKHNETPSCLMMLSDIEWLTRHLVFSLSERYIGFMDHIDKTDQPCVLISDSQVPADSILKKTSVRAIIRLEKLALFFTLCDGDNVLKAMDEDVLTAARHRLQIAVALFEQSVPERTQFFLRVTDYCKNELISNVNDDLLLAELCRAIHFFVTDDEGTLARQELTVSLSFPTFLLKDLNADTSRRVSPVFTPEQSHPITAASILLALYLGKMLSISSQRPLA